MKRTAWVITKDYIADESARQGTNANAFAMVGPKDAPKIVAQDWDGLGPCALAGRIAGHPDAVRFRMKDDDGEIYYEGHMLVGDEPGAEFTPLDDFGQPNAGATSIEIFKPSPHPVDVNDGTWVPV